LQQQGRPVPFGTLMRVYFIGYFFSNLLPSNIGGDVVRSYYIGRRVGSQPQAAVSVFIERFSGILFLLVLTVVAPLLKPDLYTHPFVFIPAAGAVVLLAGIVWLWKVPAPLRGADRVVRWIFGIARRMTARSQERTAGKIITRMEATYHWVFEHIESFHGKLIAATRYMGTRKLQLFTIVALTGGFYALALLNVYVGFRAFHVAPNFLEMSALVPTIMLVAMAPVSILGNLGFTESVYVGFFGLLGITGAASLAMSLLLRLKLLVVGAIGFFFYLGYRHKQEDVLDVRKEDAGDGQVSADE